MDIARDWCPLSPAQVADLLAPMNVPWWIAGGWAIDLFLGRATRDHADIDVAILRCDQAALTAVPSGWELFVAAEGSLTPWQAADWLEGGKRHQFWARPGPDAPWALEILLEEGDHSRWVYRRHAGVSLPVASIGLVSEGGIPFLAPEVVLLFKAKSADLAKNASDFEAALACLNAGQRRRLRQALLTAHPGHAWIERLQPEDQ